MKKFKRSYIVALLILTTVVLIIFIFPRCGIPEEEERAVFRKQCVPIIEWVESEYKKNGHYPKNLPSEYREVLESIPYPTRYIPKIDGSIYEISIGNYSVWAPFVYSYGSKDKEWYLDH